MSPSVPALRIAQIDAHDLDSQIEAILDAQLDTVFANVPDSVFPLLDRVRADVRLALRTLLWSHRWFTGASPAQHMLQLVYSSNSPLNQTLHFLVAVLLPYLLTRLPEVTRSPRIMRICARIETLGHFLYLINHLHFLRKGGYSTPVERVLRLEAKNTAPQSIGDVDFDSQNRELLWHAFRDALILATPFYEQCARITRRFLPAVFAPSDGTCVVCRLDAIAGVVGACGHLFCYYCIASSSPTERSTCTICGQFMQMDRFLKDQLQRRLEK